MGNILGLMLNAIENNYCKKISFNSFYLGLCGAIGHLVLPVVEAGNMIYVWIFQDVLPQNTVL